MKNDAGRRHHFRETGFSILRRTGSSPDRFFVPIHSQTPRASVSPTSFAIIDLETIPDDYLPAPTTALMQDREEYLRRMPRVSGPAGEVQPGGWMSFIG